MMRRVFSASQCLAFRLRNVSKNVVGLVVILFLTVQSELVRVIPIGDSSRSRSHRVDKIIPIASHLLCAACGAGVGVGGVVVVDPPPASTITRATWYAE